MACGGGIAAGQFVGGIVAREGGGGTKVDAGKIAVGSQQQGRVVVVQ